MNRYFVLAASLVFGFGIITAVVHASGVNRDVRVLNVSESATNINPGQTNTLTANFVVPAGNAATVLLDLELKDSNGNKVDQKFWDYQVVPPSHPGYVPTNYQLTTSPKLAPGIYTFSIGIFDPQWVGLIGWYNEVKTFTVGSPATGSPVLETSFLVSPTIKAGQTNRLAAIIKNIGSGNANYLVDIELYDSNNHQIGQNWNDFQPLSSGETRAYYFTTQTLDSGTYHFSVGIFNPTWKGLIQWYNSVQTFTVK